MNWNKLVETVEKMDKVGKYTIIPDKETIKDIVTLKSNADALEKVIGGSWRVIEEATEPSDTKATDFLVKIKISR